MLYVILCEGKTDSVVINHIMTSIGFKFTSKKPKLEIDFEFELLKGQSVDYFKKEDDILVIWNVAGCCNIESSIKQIIRLIKNEAKISRVSIVTDRDENEISEIESKIGSYFGESFSLKDNEWKEYQIKDSFDTSIKIKILLRIVPNEKWGALETLLVEALAKKGQEEEKLVKNVGEFIEKLRKEGSDFLKKEHSFIKAKLGCVVNIMDPERTFKDIIPVFNSINWSSDETVQKCFDKIKKYRY